MSANQDEYVLEEFVETFMLPQRAKVTEGYWFPEDVEYEFSNGDVLDLERIVCPVVTLSYKKGNCWPKISIPTQHPAKFRVLLSNSGFAFRATKASSYAGVHALLEDCPYLVRALTSYKDERAPDIHFEKGEHIRLLRTIRKNNEKFLEVKLCKQLRVVNLPLTCDAKFEEIKDNNHYTLSEMVLNLSRPRCLRLINDAYSKYNSIPGLPADYAGDLFMQKPQLLIEIHPVDSPGTAFMAPITTTIMLSPRTDNYMGPGSCQFRLEPFLKENGSILPLKVRVANWLEQTTVLENHGVYPGISLIFHKIVDRLKVLARIDDIYFAIPRDYDGTLKMDKQTFTSVHSMLNCEHMKIFVKEGSDYVETPDLNGTTTGDHLQILSNTSNVFVSVKDGVAEETPVLEMVKLHRGRRGEILHVPLDLGGIYEEDVFDCNGTVTLSSLPPSTYPVNVQLVEKSRLMDEDQDPIPCGKTLTLEGTVREPSLFVHLQSSRSISFHLPIRTRLMVSHQSRVKTGNSCIPQVSHMDNCAEILSEETYQKLMDIVKVKRLSTKHLIPKRVPIPENPERPTAPPRPSINKKRQEEELPPAPVPRRHTKETSLSIKHRPQQPLPSDPVLSPIGRRPPPPLPKPKSPGIRPPQPLPPAPVMPPEDRPPEPPPPRSPKKESTLLRGGVLGNIFRHRNVPPIPQPRTAINKTKRRSKSAERPKQKRINYESGVLGNIFRHRNVPPIPQPRTAINKTKRRSKSAERPKQKRINYENHDPATSVSNYEEVTLSTYEDVHDDYEEINDFLFGSNPQPIVNIPADSNVSSFNTEQMIVFLQLFQVNPSSLLAIKKAKVNGRKFAMLTEEELKKYDIYNPLTLHFWERTRRGYFKNVL